MIDPQVTRQLEMLKNSLPLFAETCLKVVTADGKLEPLIFNESQMRLHNYIENQKKGTGLVRVVVVKGRKQGVSTYTAARYFHKALFYGHKNIYILSHHSSTTKTLFGIVSTFYENLPPLLKLKLKTDNSKELRFENNSYYSVGTAGEGEIGRGTTPHFFHASEMASYENADALETGIFEAVSDVEGTEIIIESTAKGIGNMFHRYAINALEERGLFRLFFLPWYIHEPNRLAAPPDYFPNQEEKDLQLKYTLTREQLYWRAMKIAKYGSPWIFKQEYPSTVQEAFQSSGTSLYNAELIENARKSKLTDILAPITIGVDPARSGDRSVIVVRQGRHVMSIDTYKDMDEMRMVGILARMINQIQPAQVFIDVAHGYGVVDRLTELGFGRMITGVHFSESPMNPDLFANKRAEMAFSLRDWLSDGETRLPDSDDMAMDLLAIPDYKENSNGRILLESKENIKKVYKKSPDIFDALILTFAYPVRRRIEPNTNPMYSDYKSKSGKLGSPVLDGFSKDKQNQSRGSNRWHQ